jgi:hypothetical protein
MSDMENEADLEMAPSKTAAQANAWEMLSIAGFRNRIAEKQPNKYQAHDAESANEGMEARVAALATCLLGHK